LTTDGDRRIDVRSRSEILLLNEFVFSSFGGSALLKTCWALGCINGLLGTTVPALKDRSSKKLSRSAANFSRALSKSKSRFAWPLGVRLRLGVVASVMVELLELELLRIKPGRAGVDDLDVDVDVDTADTVSPLGVLDNLPVGEADPLDEPLLGREEPPPPPPPPPPFVAVGTSNDGEIPSPSSSVSMATKSCSVKLLRGALFSEARCSPYDTESMPAIQK
jgi:hypothetical protein